jgi:hypothetical protein
VQAEGEHREAGRGVGDVVAGHELLADHLAAAVLLHTGQCFELCSARLGSVDRRRDRPDDTVVDAAETERRLDPDRQRVTDEGVEVGRRLGARTEPIGERRHERRVGDVVVGGDPLQGLGDDVVRSDLIAEEQRRDVGDLGLAVGVRALGRQRRRGADTTESVGARRLTQATDEQGHVGALAAPVGVQLVEHQESQVAELADEAAVGVAGEHQLEHHVVGEDDVGRVLADLLAFLVVLLAGVAPVGDRRAMPHGPWPRNLSSSSFWLLASAFIG